ncbi:hypothetical protein [Legionella sp. CNM-4043-24]|uniref:hypothetical protein n=1 Tax=Legionella sp. CNM-4043-24 TaxID=3421646 RepID=UPI00403AAF75
MNRFKHLTAALTICLGSSAAMASPQYLITHNLTDVESNAFVAGMASPSPSKPNSTNMVSWFIVNMACYGHTVEGKCPAIIKMATDTSSPIELGTVYLNVESGEITPSRLSANGYTITVNAPGETTITKD